MKYKRDKVDIETIQAIQRTIGLMEIDVDNVLKRLNVKKLYTEHQIDVLDEKMDLTFKQEDQLQDLEDSQWQIEEDEGMLNNIMDSLYYVSETIQEWINGQN